MNARVLAARAPLVLVLALVLALLLARSSLARLLPFELAGVAWLWLLLAVVLALVPALLARDTPVPAAALVVVPALALSSYGASRLDWLRLLKDFGVAEEAPLDALRLGLGALALALLWALHAADVATRLRERALERGIERPQADAARRRVLARTSQALALAVAGAAGLLALALLGLQLGDALPVERAAFAVPLVAAALLVAAAAWLARAPDAS